jgi:sulfur relay (sulfurtransferase) complex TusBCD TusD component (DsrE family)
MVVGERTARTKGWGMTHILFVLNEGPYGSWPSYNGLRHALAVSRHEGVDTRVFLTGDAVACALAGQETPADYYSIDQMVSELIGEKALVGL